jgi:hypothetical protein
MLSLTGLRDDYQHQGRVLFEVMNRTSVPPALLLNQDANLELAQVYKQIEAPVGELGLNSLIISTCAESSANNGVFTDREARLAGFTKRRDDIGDEMATRLEGAEFAATPIPPQDAQRLIKQGNDLRADVAKLAGSPCSLPSETTTSSGGQPSSQQVTTLAQTGGSLPQQGNPLGLELVGIAAVGGGLIIRRRQSFFRR